MSATRDFDDIARAWLDLMPDEVPDRVVAAVVDEISRMPQVRRPGVADKWRFSQMTRLALAGAAGALVAVVLIVLALGPRPTSDVGRPPAPSASTSAAAATPSAIASGGAAAGPLQPELQHRWMGAHTSLVDGRAGTSIAFTGATLTMSQSNTNTHPVLSADVTQTGSGQIRVTTRGSGGPCDAAASGSYTWRLSESGRVLNIVEADDPCAERGQALLGTWWLMGCKAADDNCLGPLDAATYASQFVNFRQQGTAWQPLFGALTYSVPTNWANDADWPEQFGLSPQSAYDRWTPDGGTTSGIRVDLDAAGPDGRPCSGRPAGNGQSPDAVVAAMRGTPGLIVGAPNAITLDGRSGTVVDLAVDDATLRACAGGERVVEYLVTAAGGQTLPSGSKARLILLEDASGTIAITLHAPAAEFDGVVTVGMRIVKSMQFGSGGAG